MRRAGATLIELLVLLALSAGGLMVAGYATNRFGWPGLLLGFPLGFFAAFFGLYALVLTWAVFEGLASTGIPYLPTCRNGKCKSGWLTDFGNYEPEPLGGQGVFFRCQCGDLYEKRRKEKIVLLILLDCSAVRYMIWKPLRGWYPAKQNSTEAVKGE
jgi:hypothetical protein